jgi:hypothetical protein
MKVKGENNYSFTSVIINDKLWKIN